ncbi:MAG: glycosyltransferase family 39 protein [Streptosporangiaceae bacterium]
MSRPGTTVVAAGPRELQPAGAPAVLTASREVTAARPPLWLVPPVLTLAVTLWGIQGASYSRDESATLSAVQRPFHGLVRMLGRVDAVHGLYYVIMWPVMRLLGPGEVAMRLPSALAMAVAAAAIFGLGHRLVSPRAGLAAGVLFAILPEVSLYGQTARPYAMATALAAVASYLLVRAMQAAAAGETDRMRAWLLAYGACLAALGYMHVFGLLLAAAHAVPVARAWLRHPGGRHGRSLAVTWVGACVAAFAIASAVIGAGLAQRATALTWVKPGSWISLAGLTSLIGPRPMAAAAGAVVLCAVGASAIAGRTRLRANWPADLITLCVPWLILPAAILILASSLVAPVYVFRYVIFCMPAAALLAGAGLAAVGWRAGTAALAIIAVLAVPTLLQVRTAGGHGDDIRRIDRILAANVRPGDALLYLTFGEPIEMAYPYGLRQLKNVALGAPPSYSANLGGTWAPLPVVQQRIESASRMWLVQLAYGLYERSAAPTPKILRNLGFRKVRTWHTAGVWLTLYARRAVSRFAR